MSCFQEFVFKVKKKFVYIGGKRLKMYVAYDDNNNDSSNNIGDSINNDSNVVKC